MRKFLVQALMDDGINGMRIFYGENIRDMIKRQFLECENFFYLRDQIEKKNTSPDFDGWDSLDPKSVESFVNSAYDFISESRIDGDSEAQITIIDITGDVPVIEI
jgi:hypothetical protein